MFHELGKKITTEISSVLDRVHEEKVMALVHAVLHTRRIVVVGAGRVGLACKGLAMRLGHLGFAAFTTSDSTSPSLARGDLLIVASSSGETQTIYDVLLLAKKAGARTILLTADSASRMGKEAEMVIEIPAPTKYGATRSVDSIQPMATLFEQSLNIVFDIVVLLLMRETRQTPEDLWKRHTNLD